MNEQLTKALQIRYVKLHFRLRIMEDSVLPRNKASALRGGMGEMLLRANCIQDRKCETCGFERECIVRKTMYSQFERKPSFVTEGEKAGYILECEDYNENFEAGDILCFNLILFGKTIVYFNQFMQAFYMLGQEGLGKNHAQFMVWQVRNTHNEILMENNNIYMERYKVATVADYVRYRRSQQQEASCMKFKTATTIKYQGKELKEFCEDAIISALLRRIYILDCFENIDVVQLDKEMFSIKITEQQMKEISVKRYSTTHASPIYLDGIKGTILLDEEMDEDTYCLLLAGEILHIGKNTSFGFGRYRMILQNEIQERRS